MNKIIYFFLLNSLLSFAQTRGFRSVNDMNAEEPRFSFGLTKQRTASISLGDSNKDGKMDIVTANYLKPNTVFINVDGKSFEEINLSDHAARTYDVTVGDINSDR